MTASGRLVGLLLILAVLVVAGLTGWMAGGAVADSAQERRVRVECTCKQVD